MEGGVPTCPHKLGLDDLLVWACGETEGLEGTIWVPVWACSTSWLWRLVLTFSFCKCGRNLIFLKDYGEKKMR